MNETQQKGLKTELQVQLALVDRGIDVYVPISYDSRCDLIFQENNQLFKVQVKTCRLNNNSTGIVFNTCSSRRNYSEGNIREKYTRNEVDFFATSYKNEIFLVPIGLCLGTERRLNFSYCLTNRNALVMDDFKLDKILNDIRNNKTIEEIEQSVSHEYIVQLDLETGQEIKRFKSYTEAAKELGKGECAANNIGRVIRGERKTAYGFLWKKIVE